MRHSIGVDPGAQGGFAVVREWEIVETHKMPDGELSMWLYISGLHKRYPKSMWCLERVGGYMPGSRGNIGSAMFNFGRNFGALLAMLYALDVTFVLVTPQVWQKAVGVVPREKDETKEQHKRKLRDRARTLYPTQSVTLTIADAVLLAHYVKTI